MLLHQLEVFLQVAEKESFTKAAEALFLSQSTVSAHISNLEKNFGQKLFDRLGKEVVLTPFGKTLYPWAREILALKDKALWEMKDWTGKIEGHLSIAAGTVPAQYVIPFLLSKFLNQYHGITFVLEQSGSEKAAEKLIKGEAEIGILGKQYYQDQLHFIPFIEEKLVLITPANLQFANDISITDLLDYPFLFRQSDSGTQANLEKMLNAAGVPLSELKVIGHFDSLGTLMEGVKEGIGISIISAIAAANFADKELINAYQIPELSGKRTFYFAHHKKRTLTPLAKAFMNFCLEDIKFQSRRGNFLLNQTPAYRL
ncbi:selenium metabolism-associated LysR family transcriptional regulator [Paradesulfitobacterium ferrireducens]|uniref:selenium metabolism-associated LysR family transcriptional regulator n=1 Tax=Paradesulfitobacterium ferrireducens TaxID=2816476 RepID=UPI001A8F5FBC|nr:selenium metabolism-associated LysR family transcriptional regulator [Paradesulfitobacterium ferrireducens]